MVIAQISDLHIKAEGQLAYGRVDTAKYLGAAVAHLLTLDPRPEAVLATGDLVDAGSVDEYRRLRALLAPLPMPVYLIPGNHDARDAMREVFADHDYLPRAGFIQYVVNRHAVRLVALDTLVAGTHGGLLCAERLAWLDARLREAPERPTLIFMHHPPFVTGIAFMDGYGLANAEGLGDVLRRHTHVEAVVCGHVHRPMQIRWAGTLVSTSPSTAHQVALDLRPDGDGAFIMEPPACQLHVWTPGVGLVTHTSYIGEYSGPHRFRSG